MDENHVWLGENSATCDLSITAGGQILDFHLSPQRKVAAARRFPAITLRLKASADYPQVISTGTAPALITAIAEPEPNSICPPTVEHQQVNTLGHVPEGDHGRWKRILDPEETFKKRASA